MNGPAAIGRRQWRVAARMPTPRRCRRARDACRAGSLRASRRLALLLVLCVSLAPVASASERPAAPPSSQHIQRLIEALGDANYFVRQKAESELRKIGFAAVDALTAAGDHDDMEIAMRARRLLAAIRNNWVVPGESPLVSPLLANYEAQDDCSREVRILQLIALPEKQGIPAVCRIIRYERSLLLAKTAALGLLQAMAGQSAEADTTATVAKHLRACRRGAARWVAAWLETRQDATAFAKRWTGFIGDEEELLRRQPGDTSLAVIEGLLRFQVAALRKMGQSAEAAASVQRLIGLRRNQPAELAALLKWFIEQKDWSATRLAEKSCKATIAESADLLYLAAEARLRQGDAATAAAAAGLALRLDSNSDDASLAAHFQAARTLQQRGRFDWAAREWQYVIHSAPPHSQVGVAAARCLAELHHDLEEDDRAAETLGGIDEAFAGRSDQWPLFDQESDVATTLGALRARKHYFEACRWKARGDQARQRKCLDKALATQFFDIEALIACYQMPDSPAEYRAKVRALIEKRLSRCANRSPISAAPPPRRSPATTLPGWPPIPRAISTKPCGWRNVRSKWTETTALLRYARASLFRPGRLCPRSKHQAALPNCCPTTAPSSDNCAVPRKGQREARTCPPTFLPTVSWQWPSAAPAAPWC